jgi:2-polyprenyl-6-methoxyphenol hydroxylase-like FAD-dependent oxidoreductase
VAKIIVLGAGVSGLAAGLLLARDGHTVTVLERDGGPMPASAEEAWEHWGRSGVTQFRQAHYLTPRGREVLEVELPDAAAGVEAAGARRFDVLGLMPPGVGDWRHRDGDERFVTLLTRRSTLEYVLATLGEAQPGMEVRRGASVRGLTTRRSDGAPQVSGARLESGEELTADLVVDAMGRGSRLPQWLAAAGTAPIAEEAEDSGFLYYTRFFRSRGGAQPEFRAPLLTEFGTFSVLTVPAEKDVWSVTLYAAAGDQPLKRLRDAATWSAVLGACPRHAHWLDGEPITGVTAMGGIVDRYRRLVSDGGPVVTGLALLGDACTCTNPSLGRGMTLGLVHAARLRDVVRSHVADPGEFASAWDAVTESELTPWYRETVAEDRARRRYMAALRAGREPEAPGGTAGRRLALVAAARTNADAFRAYLANRSCFALERELWQDPGVATLASGARGSEARGSGGPRMPGPDRERLLGLIAGASAPA